MKQENLKMAKIQQIKINPLAYRSASVFISSFPSSSQSIPRVQPEWQALAWHPHSSIAWRVPWTEDPDGLWSTGFQRVEHYWHDSMHTCMLANLWFWWKNRHSNSISKFAIWRHFWFASQYFFFLSIWNYLHLQKLQKLYIEFLYTYS